MLTSFVKVSVVLALLRNALGAPEAPSGLVVMGVSLMLTFFVMAPVAVDMARAAATAPGSGDPGAGPGPGAPAGAGGAGERTPAGGGGAGAKVPAGENKDRAAGAPVNPYPHGGSGAPIDPYPARAADARGGDTEGAPLVRVDVEGAVRQLVPAQYRGTLDAAERAIG